MPVYVLTGSNRGIGLEFIHQPSTSTNPHYIFAGVRSLSNDLSDLKSLAANASSGCTIKILECDTSSSQSIESFATEIVENLDGSKINVLINVSKPQNLPLDDQ